MARKSTRPEVKFSSIRAFVDSHPRSVTQQEIADTLGVSGQLLSAYLSGRSIPSPETALRFFREHGIDLEGILDPPREHESVAQ